MRLRMVEETPIRPSPFNPDATWLRAQWFGSDGMSVEVEVADLLYSFIRAVKPQTVLETGTWKGFSTRAIATALKANGFGVVTTVDKVDQKYIPYVLTQSDLAEHKDGKPTFEKIEADVFDSFDKFEAEGRKFNVIFCDDLHDDEHVKKELARFDKLITHPGYVLFHDTYFTKLGDISKTVREWSGANGHDHLPFYTSRGFDIVHVK